MPSAEFLRCFPCQSHSNLVRSLSDIRMTDFSRRRLLQSGAIAPLIWGCRENNSAADIVLTNGDVHTVDGQNNRARAVAIKANRIVAVGNDQQISRHVTPATEIFDLEGRSVLPGINDSHLHLLGWGLSNPPFSLDLTYPNVKSIADCVAQVRTQVLVRAPGEWIVGRGWDQPYLAEGRAPTAADLDAVAPNHPVALTDFSGHALWANSLALRLTGIDQHTVPSAGGVIVKDAAGVPTGLLFESAAWMVRNTVPQPSAEQQKAILRDAMLRLLKRGVTSCTVPGQSIEVLQVMNELASEPGPKIRVTGLLRATDNLAGLEHALASWSNVETPDPLWFQAPGVKIMGDGIPTANKTAWLHEPYVGGGNGSLLIQGDGHDAKVRELEAMVETIHGHGLQIGTHVTGDRSVDAVIKAYARAQAGDGNNRHRHYVIHGDLISPETLTRMATLGVGANFNPEIKHLIADSQIHSIGPERAAYEWPYRTALDAGVMVASSSDAPVTPGNWLQGLATMMERKGKQTGAVSGPAQRISLDEAIRTYTWAGAWQDHAETYKGAIKTGYVGDLTVIDGRLSMAEPDKLAEQSIYMTLVDGQVV